MDQAEMQHMQQTLRLAMVALETSRIALNKARNEDLKRFANIEVREQTALAAVLRSMMDPGATAGIGPSGSARQGDMQMDASGRNMLETLQSQQAGAPFDKAYWTGNCRCRSNICGPILSTAST